MNHLYITSVGKGGRGASERSRTSTFFPLERPASLQILFDCTALPVSSNFSLSHLLSADRTLIRLKTKCCSNLVWSVFSDLVPTLSPLEHRCWFFRRRTATRYDFSSKARRRFRTVSAEIRQPGMIDAVTAF